MDSKSQGGRERVFTPTIFLGAFLLFELEFIIAKKLLPWFGGTPAVWSVCLVFFQLVLLAGYVYAHVLVSHLSIQSQRVTHSLVLGATIILLVAHAWFWPSPVTPGAAWKPLHPGDPTTSLLLLLVSSVGLPFFVLATTTPLLQSWYVRGNPESGILPVLRRFESRIDDRTVDLSVHRRAVPHHSGPGNSLVDLSSWCILPGLSRA